MESRVKVGVIDLGSNSTKVLLSSVSKDGDVQKIREKSFSCRLINLESIEDGRIAKKIQEDLHRSNVYHHILTKQVQKNI